MNAYCLIREAPWYRRDIFVQGIARAGHKVMKGTPDKMDENTLLVIWNRYASNHMLAQQVERAGGLVIVAENGYLGKGGTSPKFDVHPDGPKPHHYYSLSMGYHNDDTRLCVGPENRWDALEVEVKPWRVGGDYLLVCPNRSFGVSGRIMPTDWTTDVVRRLKYHTDLPVRIRAHPGNNAPKRTIHEDLKNAAAVIVWTSSCGIHAMVEGVPVICEAPYWICKAAAPSIKNLEQNDWGAEPDRERALKRMAWAQWTCAEIATGVPFKELLQ